MNTAAEYAACLEKVSGRALGLLGPALGAGMVAHLAAGAITTNRRLAHFLAQTCEETGGYRYLHELGGPNYLQRYDGRADLGNLRPGDGARFKGRGLIQLTGRANYARMATALGLDLVEHPELAETPDVAVATAVRFWSDHNLNAYADRDDIEGLTRRVNGGLNGFAERQRYLARAKAYLGPDPAR